MVPANDVASVIIARHGAWLDAMSLQKLLYYVQAWHLAITDEPLFPDAIKAWRDGPVVPSVRIARKDVATRRPAVQDLSAIHLDETASGVIDLVVSTYGSMSAQELSALTHAETPWRLARGDAAPGAVSHEPIDPAVMARFYRAERQLGGRAAADLAAAGIWLRSLPDVPVDVDVILATLPDELDDPGDDPWGGANLDDPPPDCGGGTGEARSREYAGS